MRGLRPLVEGQRIITALPRRAGLRSPFPRDLSARLQGAVIRTPRRRGKYILLPLSTDETILVHLGMTGGFYVRPNGQPEKHDHLLLTFEGGLHLGFHDPRRFGQIDLMTAGTVHPSLALLGPEPLADDFTPDVLARALHRRRSPIKPALLDQRVVVGIGNIYAAEALFAARIHPGRLCLDLKAAEIDRLHAALRTVLQASIAAGGSTLRDYRHPDGSLGFFQDRFAVYGRAGQKCPGCRCGAGAITREIQGGRSTFFCPHKQSLTTNVRPD